MNKLFLLILIVSFHSSVFCQKGVFEDIEVIKFESPYNELIINCFGVELPVIINKKTSLKGLKKKKINPQDIEGGTLIEKLSYELVGEQYVALSVETDISPDGSMSVKGLFEGIHNGKAMVDGYPIEVPEGVQLVGSKKKNKCQCKGLVIPNFKSPLIPPGSFYIEVDGKMNDLGVIKANKVTLCRNGFGKPEQELLASVNNNLTNGTSVLQNIPTELAGTNMNLYNGEVKVGQYSYKLVEDIKLQGYINQIGYKLLPKRDRKKQMEQGLVYYRFYVIDDPIPNAFAFPNGMIFIHTGILDIIENEAQLAAILGHEIAHVTHEHGRERYENTSLIDIGKSLTDIVFDASLPTIIGKTAPGLPLGMVNTISQVSGAVTPAGISNIMKPQTKMEAQADRVGLYYAYKAGYDIREAAKFWDKMQSLTGDQSFQSKITSALMTSLQSPRLSFSNGTVIGNLSAVGSDVLSKQILDTIYTSHPKAKKRARAVNQLVSSVYGDVDWDKKKVKEVEYLEKIK